VIVKIRGIEICVEDRIVVNVKGDNVERRRERLKSCEADCCNTICKVLGSGRGKNESNSIVVCKWVTVVMVTLTT